METSTEKPTIIEVAEEQKPSMSLQEISQKLTQLNDTINKFQISINSFKQDNDKMKGQITDKISKAVLVELENKVNTHGKALEATTKKLHEMQQGLNAFIQQPISSGVIDKLRKQIVDEIMMNVNKIMASNNDTNKKFIDEELEKVKGVVNNSKKFLYVGKK